MQFEHSVEVGYTSSFKTDQIAGMFDIDPKANHLKKSWTVDMPFEDIEDWHVGLIVGPSGSGKTTIAKHAFGDQYHESFDWTGDSIIDNFPKDMKAKDIVNRLGNVGLSSPPSWIKPFHVLSNGEKFRAEMARLIAETQENEVCVVDEFTSLVDRQVAKVASHCVAKNIRKLNRKFVAVTCHSDIEEWLEPDWIYEVDTGTFRRGSLRRPELTLTVERRSGKIWDLFAGHHYLDTKNHKSSHCYVACLDGQPVAFTSVLKFPHAHINMRNMWRASRSVVLPDYQGMGIGCKLTDSIAQMYVSEGKRFRATTSHPAMISYRERSHNWKLVRKPGKAPKPGKNSKISSQSNERLTASYEYLTDEQVADFDRNKIVI